MSKQLKLILTTEQDEKLDRSKPTQQTQRRINTQRNEIRSKHSEQQILSLDSPKFSKLHKHSFQIENFLTSTNQLKKSNHFSKASTSRSPRVDFDQEKFIVKQFWRNLQRWQGFDDYVYMRNPQNLRIIKGREILQKNDIVETLNLSSNNFIAQNQLLRAEENLDEYKQLIRRQQLGQMKKMYQPGEVNYQKFNPQIHKQTYIDTVQIEFIIQSDKQNILIEKVLKILKSINERLIQDEIIAISQLGEKMVKSLWKVGCLNLFLMGIYIHNLNLILYGKEKIAYSNWKKIIRICNLQGNQCHKFKQVAYKHISEICIKLQLYDKSIIYLKKLLKLSWVINDTNYELYTYDKISLCYYYKQDIEKAIFYHEKFTQGESELPNQGLRMIGEVAYLLNSKLKDNQIDQNSYSEDDFDLDALVNTGNFNKWEMENKRKDLHLNAKKMPVQYKKGPSFGKISRNSSENIDLRKAKVILHQYQNKQLIPLGPLFKKEDKNSFLSSNFLMLKANQSDQKKKQCQFYINQKSTNREAANFLLQEEIKDHQGQEICFKPQENAFYLKKLIKVFSFDLQYFINNNKLFQNGAFSL